jgi:hypothetical protein
MNRIPTAEEFYKQITGCVINHVDIKKAMIEFAKLHVEAALKAASKNAKTIRDKEFFALHNVSKSSILNAYSLNNIK